MKSCPFCAEQIQDAAVSCRYCGRDLPGAPPVPVAEQPQAAMSSPPAVRRWGFARGATRIVALTVVGAAVLISGFGSTQAILGFILAWAGLTTLIRTPFPLLGAMLTVCLAGVVISPSVQIGNQLREARMRDAAEAATRAERARLPALDQELQTHMAAGRWTEADAVLQQIRRIQADYPSLPAASARVEPALRELRAKATEAGRIQQVDQGIALAKQVVADKKRCDTPKAVGDAWSKLKVVNRTDSSWREASALAAKLEGCRKAMERQLSRNMQNLMIQQRVQWAEKAEKQMLDQGMDTNFILSGPAKDRLTIKWVLMGRAAAHKITGGGSIREGSFLANLEKIGFRRATFTDGYNESWYYDLNPPSESEGGKTVLNTMDLGTPLVLK